MYRLCLHVDDGDCYCFRGCTQLNVNNQSPLTHRQTDIQTHFPD